MRERESRALDPVDHHRDEQVRLGRETAVQGADRDAGELRYLVHPDTFGVVLGTQVRRRLQDAAVPRAAPPNRVRRRLVPTQFSASSAPSFRPPRTKIERSVSHRRRRTIESIPVRENHPRWVTEVREIACSTG